MGIDMFIFMQKLNRQQKLLIGVGLLLLAAVGLYLVQKKENNQNLNENQNINVPGSVIDTSDWVTYNEPQLGVEFKYPSDWTKTAATIGPDINSENSFWRDIDGRDYLEHFSDGKLLSQLHITVKQSDLSLDDFWNSARDIGLSDKAHGSYIASHSAKIDTLTFTDDSDDVNKLSSLSQTQHVLIKAGDRFVFLSFETGSKDTALAKHEIAVWQKVLDGLKVEDSEWITYNEPQLGIKFTYPKGWSGGTTSIGKGVGEDPFWQEDILGMAFWSGRDSESLINLSLMVKSSDLSLDEFWDYGKGMGLTNSPKHILVNGFPAIVDGGSVDYSEVPDFYWESHKQILIKNNKNFYYFDWSSGADTKEKLLSTFEDFDSLISSIKFSEPIK